MSHFNKIILDSIIGFIYVLYYIPCLGFIQTSNLLSPNAAVVTRRFDTVRSLYFIEVYILLRRHLCRELYILCSRNMSVLGADAFNFRIYIFPYMY